MSSGGRLAKFVFPNSQARFAKQTAHKQMAENFPTAHAYCTRKYTICPAPKFAAIYLSCPRARSSKYLALVRKHKVSI